MKNKYDRHSHDIKIANTTGKAYFEESIDAPHKTFIVDSSPWPSSRTVKFWMSTPNMFPAGGDSGVTLLEKGLFTHKSTK